MRRGRGTYAYGFVGQAHVLRVGVCFRMHRYGFHTQFTTGALDAERNLAAVGDEDLLEHCTA